MTAPRRLHVTFGYSAAGSLMAALAQQDRTETVVPLVDDFSMGPLDPGDVAQRAAWGEEHLDDPEASAHMRGEAWRRDTVASWRDQVVIWISSRAVAELCGLHALLWRFPDANLHVVDVATVGHDGPFASMHHARMLELGLLDRATPLGDLARASHLETWARLRRENAPLRVLAEDGLASAPIDHHDDCIRAQVTDHWQSCARVLGQSMAVTGFGEWFLVTRLLRLVDRGEFEEQVDDGPWTRRTSRIRRRP